MGRIKEVGERNTLILKCIEINLNMEEQSNPLWQRIDLSPIEKQKVMKGLLGREEILGGGELKKGPKEK